ncbi:MAG: biotin/lipoyl-binding protein [Planctomycetota bacterium]
MATVDWRLREDLELRAAQGGLWVLKDPLRLSYFRMSDAELSLLQRAGSGEPLERLSAELAAEHPDFDWAPDELRRFLAGAVRSGLMCPLVPGRQGAGLPRRSHGSGVSAALRAWWSVVSFRWRGIDPSGLLRWLSPVTNCVLTPLVLAVGVCVVLLGISLTLTQREVLVNELPGLARLLAPGNLILMTAALVLVRGLHELGHAAVCRHFGGECRELGVQLTLLIPFPYCDVSDSWLWPERWKRMAVAGAGMAVEFFLAAVCALLWTCTHPGLLHDFCLNVMLLCSLNTLLVNGNPLLRYDGYYLLSDFCGVPNLAEAGNEHASTLLRRLLTGESLPGVAEHSRVARAGLALYGLAAGTYRLTITAGLLTLIYRFAEPSGLGWAAVAPGILALLLTAGHRLRSILTPLWTGQTTLPAKLRLIAVTGVLAAVLFVPFSVSLRAPFVFVPGNCATVYVKGAGHAEWLVKAGTRVARGDVLARLSNGDLELKIAEAEGEIARRRAAAAGLRLRQLESGSGDSRLAAAEELLESAGRRLELLKQAEAELIIRSPRGGIVFPPRNLPQVSGIDRDRRTVLNASEVLDSGRRGSWLEPGTELCVVGEYSDLRAVACLQQSDVELLTATAESQLRFDSSPDRPVAGLLESVSETVLQVVPPELVVTQRIPTSGHGAPEAGVVWYTASVRPLNAGAATAPVYTTGTVLLETGPASLWTRLRRLVSLTFTWPF